MSDITAFEALVASDSEGKIAKQAAADKLAAAIYDVREQFGAHLLCAKTKDEFNDRVALCKDDMMKVVNAHLMPVTGVMRKVCKTMEREWRQKLAYDEDGDFDALVADRAPAAPSGPRPLHEIARDIKHNWPKVNYAAQPYLDALHELNSVDDMYYQDPASSIVNYFLSNSGTWRGPEAKRIKDELKGMVRRASKVAGEGQLNFVYDDEEPDQDYEKFYDRKQEPGKKDPNFHGESWPAKKAYTDEDLAAYAEMFENSPVGGQHAHPPHGDAEEWHPHPEAEAAWGKMFPGTEEGLDGLSIRRADNTGPVQSIDQTFSPSDADLIPEGDFAGYLDSVDQGAPSQVQRDFEARRRLAVDGVGGSAPQALPPSPAPAPAPGSGGNINVSPPGFNMPDNGNGSPDVMDNGQGIQGGTAMTASVIKRYAQWCVDNLARPSYTTLEYYAAHRPDKEYLILASALQRHAWNEDDDDLSDYEERQAFGESWNPAWDKETDPIQTKPKAKGKQGHRTAAGKDYLQQADEAITNLLNEKAEEFQQGIQPLQQALQTIQYAQQVQQAQNPMNVMPPAGTVNVLPQGQAPQGPAPQGVDPSSGQIDPAMLAQLMGQGGIDPSMLGSGGAPQGDPQSGPPPAAAEQGAIPPGMAQQIQARRRQQSAVSELGYDWPVDDESEYHPDPRTEEEWHGKPNGGKRGGHPKG